MRYTTYLTRYLEQTPYSAPGSSYSARTVSLTLETNTIASTTVSTITTATKQPLLRPTPLGQDVT